ncbi:MAG: transcription elongation factor GreA [Oscillospiraceae bacterium]
MANEVVMTSDGYEKLKDEVEFLKTVRRQEISEKIRVARGYGDLSENSEYDEAKNDQAIVESRIMQIEEQLKTVKIICTDQIDKNTVSVGTKVKILDMEFNDVLEYRIVSSLEGNGDMDTITDTSPVGIALLGRKIGDVVNATVPTGVIQFKIMGIDV